VLCKHFEDFPERHFHDKKVVEVGSGTGLVGIFVAQLGTHCHCLVVVMVVVTSAGVGTVVYGPTLVVSAVRSLYLRAVCRSEGDADRPAAGASPAGLQRQSKQRRMRRARAGLVRTHVTQDSGALSPSLHASCLLACVAHTCADESNLNVIIIGQGREAGYQQGGRGRDRLQ
jgi:hypothetical protein